MICTVPAHLPGTDVIAVSNFQGSISQYMSIEYTVPPNPNSASTFIATLTGSTNGSMGNNIYPPFGPRDLYTSVRIRTNNPGAVYCYVNSNYILVASANDTSVSCSIPPSTYSGKTRVYLTTSLKVAFAQYYYFEYIEDAILQSVEPTLAFVGSQLLLRGHGFLRYPPGGLTCVLDDLTATTVIVSDKIIVCTVPFMAPSTYRVTLQTNGQHFLSSGTSYTTFDLKSQLLLVFVIRIMILTTILFWSKMII